MRRSIMLLLFLGCVLAADGQPRLSQALKQLLAAPFDQTANTFNGCPEKGKGTTPAKIASNRQKNRFGDPQPSDIDKSVTMGAMIAAGPDADRFDSRRAVEITGYMRDIGPGGISNGESCNCGERRALFGDTHMDLVPDKNHQGNENVVVAEVSPRVRWLKAHDGEDWTTPVLKKKYRFKKVRIRGWLFFDTDHLKEAWNTDPQDTKGRPNWRRTCWEIHPVTSIEIIE